jgi:hypothetical protein
MDVRPGFPLQKRWRYVGVYGDDVMLCAGRVAVGPLRQSFWAVLDRRARRMHEHTAWGQRRVLLPDGALRVAGRGVELDLRLEAAGEPIELTSLHDGRKIWTRKLPLRAVGTLRVDGVARRIDAAGLLDDSAGRHARRTQWEWSAGVGTTAAGVAVTWNLVRGLHDSGAETERAIWLDGAPHPAGAIAVSPGLDHVTSADGTDLHFTAEAVREAHEKAGPLLASDYVQPFGLFSGALSGGVTLETGFGVMERHAALW